MRSAPASSLIPWPNVEVAEVESTSRAPFMLRPALVNVEVAVPRTVKMPAMSAVEEAESAPLTLKLAVAVEDALVMKPESKVVRPLNAAVDDAEKEPPTSKSPATVEEAEEMKPESSMVSPLMFAVDDASMAPAALMRKSGLFAESTNRSMSPV